VIIVCDGFSKLLKIIVAPAEKLWEVKCVSETPKPDMYFGRRKRYTFVGFWLRPGKRTIREEE
jgi:hypothetical protein